MGTSPERDRWRREARRKIEECILASGHWTSDWADRERGYIVVGCVECAVCSVQGSKQCASLSVYVIMQCVVLLCNEYCSVNSFK